MNKMIKEKKKSSQNKTYYKLRGLKLGNNFSVHELETNQNIIYIYIYIYICMNLLKYTYLFFKYGYNIF